MKLRQWLFEKWQWKVFKDVDTLIVIGKHVLFFLGVVILFHVVILPPLSPQKNFDSAAPF